MNYQGKFLNLYEALVVGLAWLAVFAGLFFLLVAIFSWATPALAQDCSQWMPDQRPLCEKQKRSIATVENLVAHSPLDQEGSFQRIEQMKAREQAIARHVDERAAVVSVGSGGGHLGKNALAEHAETQRAQSGAGDRHRSRSEREGAADEALLRQSQALGVAPVLPDRTTHNTNVNVNVDARGRRW